MALGCRCFFEYQHLEGFPQTSLAATEKSICAKLRFLRDTRRTQSWIMPINACLGTISFRGPEHRRVPFCAIGGRRWHRGTGTPIGCRRACRPNWAKYSRSCGIECRIVVQMSLVLPPPQAQCPQRSTTGGGRNAGRKQLRWHSLRCRKVSPNESSTAHGAAAKWCRGCRCPPKAKAGALLCLLA